MKKKKILVIGIISIVVIVCSWILLHETGKRFKIDKTIKEIRIRNGNTGNMVNINDEYQIEVVINRLNELELKKSLFPVKSYTGWKVILDLYPEDGSKDYAVTIRNDGIIYKNYYYGTNKETVKLQDYLLEVAEKNG